MFNWRAFTSGFFDLQKGKWINESMNQCSGNSNALGRKKSTNSAVAPAAIAASAPCHPTFDAGSQFEAPGYVHLSGVMNIEANFRILDLNFNIESTAQINILQGFVRWQFSGDYGNLVLPAGRKKRERDVDRVLVFILST